MPTSPAQIEANRRNAQRSTGPKTEEGKAASRANALKHGLTGAGIVIPPEDLAEVERRGDSFETDLRPSNDVGRFLARRAAALSVRLDRSVRQEFAAVADRVRNADRDFREAARAEIERLLTQLAIDPTAARRLGESPEGIDALIARFEEIRAGLDGGPGRWDIDQARLVEQMIGRRAEDPAAARDRAIDRAGWGELSRLAPEDGAGLSIEDRRLWARRQIAARIDAQVAALRAAREAMDFPAIAQARAEAPARALFDPSKEADRARKYEAATQRDFFRTLHELRQAEDRVGALAEAEAAAPAVAATPHQDPVPEELASSFPEPSGFAPAPDRPAPTPAPIPYQAIGGTRKGPRSVGMGCLGGDGLSG